MINLKKIKKVDFIKLDVDGHELDVLKSGEKFLKTKKPVIFIEIAPYLYPEFNYKCSELISYIKNLKYSYYNENLKKIVKDLGISSNLFDKCLIDENISDKILNGRIDANKKYSVNSTPTIIINEKKLEGSATFENIKKIIEKII